MFKGNDESSASDIEITSYALLAMMEQQTAENMAYAHSIAQWLMSKMGPTGGFKSTQVRVNKILNNHIELNKKTIYLF